MTRAWTMLAAIAAAAVALDASALRSGERPLIDRRTCVERPSSHTLALDRSRRGDLLYRFVYATLFGLGGHGARSGFPHVEVAPVCTVGWKDPVAALKIGPRIFLVTLDGTRVVSVRVSGSALRRDDLPRIAR